MYMYNIRTTYIHVHVRVVCEVKNIYCIYFFNKQITSAKVRATGNSNCIILSAEPSNTK